MCPPFLRHPMNGFYVIFGTLVQKELLNMLVDVGNNTYRDDVT
jgi:hypothetical protein